MSIDFTELRLPNHNFDETYTSTFKRYFQAIGDLKYGPKKIRQEFYTATGIAPNTTYSYGSGSTLETDTTVAVKYISLDPVSEHKDCKQWNIVVDYGPWNPLTHAETPLDIPATVHFGGETILIPLTVDALSGDPVVNKAYDYFDPAPEREYSRKVLTVGLNVAFADLDPVTVLNFADKVNDSSWYGFDPKTWKVGCPSITREYHVACGNYWHVEFTLAHNEATWKKYILNQGYREYVSGNTGFAKKQNIFINEQPITKPCFLDSSGRALTPPVDSSNIIVLDFDAYETLDFSTAFAAFPSDLFG